MDLPYDVSVSCVCFLVSRIFRFSSRVFRSAAMVLYRGPSVSGSSFPLGFPNEILTSLITALPRPSTLNMWNGQQDEKREIPKAKDYYEP